MLDPFGQAIQNQMKRFQMPQAPAGLPQVPGLSSGGGQANAQAAPMANTPAAQAAASPATGSFWKQGYQQITDRAKQRLAQNPNMNNGPAQKSALPLGMMFGG